MNQAEMFAFEILKKRGYNEEEIIYQGSKTPDFICNDGKRFEVKRIYGKNELLFSEKQMKELQDNDIILVFNTELGKLNGEFLWSNVEKQSNFKITVIKYPKNKLQITISDKTYEILKRRMKEIGYTQINTYAAMLLSHYIDEKDKKGFDDGFG